MEGRRGGGGRRRGEGYTEENHGALFHGESFTLLQHTGGSSPGARSARSERDLHMLWADLHRGTSGRAISFRDQGAFAPFGASAGWVGAGTGGRGPGSLGGPGGRAGTTSSGPYAAGLGWGPASSLPSGRMERVSALLMESAAAGAVVPHGGRSPLMIRNGDRSPKGARRGVVPDGGRFPRGHTRSKSEPTERGPALLPPARADEWGASPGRTRGGCRVIFLIGARTCVKRTIRLVVQ